MNANDQPELPPMTNKKLREKVRKMRRFFIWTMDTLAALEARTAHQIEECYKIEQRLGRDAEDKHDKPLGSPPGSLQRMEAEA